ncbi:MAG: hypothetical protein V4613_03820 [Bacteroidota bacterium]
MGLFKRLFGKSENEEQKGISSKEEKDLFLKMLGELSGEAEISTNTPELFKSELYETASRYYSSPEIKPKLNLTDAKGNTYMEHEAFDYTYSEWKKIRSVWDRRTILFEHWDKSQFNNLQKWQIIERYVKDRMALKAVEFQRTSINQDDFQDIRLIVALSKLYRALDSIPQALHYSKGAYELRPDLDIVTVEYATVLYLSHSDEDKAISHKLMNEVIANKIKNEPEGKKIPLLNYFIFSTDFIDSSIFAINFLRAGNVDDATWGKLAEEYYWCPVYRFEHSVFLSQNGDSLRALAKLNSLADEFPWYKTGVLANIDAINQLRIQNNNPSFMSEEMNRMEQYQSMWKE